MGWMRRLNERLSELGRVMFGRRYRKLTRHLGHFTPYQLILGTLTLAYAIRHLDDLLGIGGQLLSHRAAEEAR